MATVFNDLPSAIEEDRFMRKKYHRDYGVFQCTDVMKVKPAYSGIMPMFSTRHDKYGTVNTEVRV
ncbi:hypothetical protein [Serratia fonticola]|uniref:hypothetical protein n=1 Tax=Serratia fonticola TaxID=47917 RepID=UPI003AB08D1B